MAVVKITTESFISESVSIHGAKYGYDKTEYVRIHDSVIINCPIHGYFEQIAQSHLRGHGCRECSYEKRGSDRKRSNAQIIKEAMSIHGDKYDYSLLNYVNQKQNVIIICKKHGSFSQIAANHLLGQGCPKCGHESKAEHFKFSKERFVEISNTAHDYKYNYSKVIYKNSRTPVVIICPIHGEFLQQPVHHMGGHGCAECGNTLNSFKKKQWIEKSKNKIGIFYIIRCFNETESFYKYGITFNSLKSRYGNKKKMPYEYETVRLIMSTDKDYIWDLEKRFGKIKRNDRYSPTISFLGSTYECFQNFQQRQGTY